jgi:hypothetical protein
VAWRVAWQAQPGKGLVPDLSGEKALDKQVVYRFWGLIEEGACSGMLQSLSSKPIGSPASVQVGKPMENFDTRRCPAFPDHLPGRR